MKAILVLLTVLMFASFVVPVTAAKQSTLSDLSGFDKIEKRKLALLATVNNDTPLNQIVFPCLKELHDLRNRVEAAPVEKRERILRDAVKKSKWGTKERYTACYVCAWYDIDYIKNRNYMEHLAGLPDERFGGLVGPEGKEYLPYSPGSGTEDLDLLYHLYEHNQDFNLLHDIVASFYTDGNDVPGRFYIQPALKDHPRGLLHVAAISWFGWRTVYDCLLEGRERPNTKGLSAEDSKQALEWYKAELRFRQYIKRVAADPKDPLSSLAKGLLKPHHLHPPLRGGI